MNVYVCQECFEADNYDYEYRCNRCGALVIIQNLSETDVDILFEEDNDD